MPIQAERANWGIVSRRDVVAARIADLIAGFGGYVRDFDDHPAFSADQLAAHRQTIRLRAQSGSASAAVSNPAFVASLRQTLVAWRLDSRASHLAPPAAFADALQRASARISEFNLMAIDDVHLAPDLPDRLWTLIHELDVVDNKAKLVAGTKTLHHLLPDLVPPMDRAWTGRFFGLHAPEWHSEENQHRTFRRLFLAFRDIARATDPSSYTTGDGWRTSRTKILDNALVSYTRLHIDTSTHAQPEAISFLVPGTPPMVSHTAALLPPGNDQAERVRILLDAARKALQDSPRFTALDRGPISLDVVVHSESEVDAADAATYLGGIAEALQGEAGRAEGINDRGGLTGVRIHLADWRIEQMHYRQVPGPSNYRISITRLDDIR